MAAIETVPAEDTFRLREYLGVLWARKWSIIALTLVAVLASAFYTIRQTPVYTSQISVLATNPTASIDSPAGLRIGPNMPVERSLVASLPVTQCAFAILSHPDVNHIGADLSDVCSADALAKVVPPTSFKKNVNVVVQEDSTVMTVQVTDPSPQRAQAKAQALALAYVDYKVTQAKANLAERRAPIQKQLEAVGKALTEANAQLAQHLASAAANGTQCGACPSDTQRISGLTAQQGQLNQQLLQLSDTNIAPPQTLSPATLPASPSSPNKKLNIALGLMVGLALGVAIAFLRERLDDRLRGRGDLEEAAGVPVLAVIPKVPGWRRRQESRLVTLSEPKSAVSEAYRTLRTSILFASIQRGMKTMMVCSALAGDGKTTTASNLSVVLADAGKRVILVSADLRKPRLHHFFNVDNDTGLSNVLAGEIQPWEPLKDPGVENLRIMPSGPVPARPAELLSSEQMGELVASLREVADFVIIDTAPVLLVADASALAPLVDGVLIVADAENSTKGSIGHTREQLEQIDAPVIGAVLNNFDPAKARYGYGSYRYGYGGYRYRYGYGGYGGYGTYGTYGATGPGNGEPRRAERPLAPSREREGS